MAVDSIIVSVSLALISGLFFLWRKADISLDAREPPIAPSKLPFIGHIVGMIRHQIGYFEILCSKSRPIFTFKIFNTRIYVPQSPELAALIIRDAKSFTFDTFTVAFTKNALGCPPDILDIIQNTTYLAEIHHEMYSALSIGPDLLESNSRVLNVLSRYLVPQETNLYTFLRDAYTIASGETLYGPVNPVPDLIDVIWDFEENIGILSMGLYPQITARKAYQSQRLVSKAFTAYYDAGLDKNANKFVQRRATAARKFNLDNKALGMFEISICFAPVTNVVPTVFWMLNYIYSDRNLLRDLRDEVAKLSNPLDITKLRSCPLLVSTFQETQRMYQHGNLVRFVTADTVVNGYLLKQGSIIQIPSSVLNTASSTWGPDSRTFNARRFMDLDDKKARQNGFNPFGGGRHLCPGRHLAFTETLGFVAAFVKGFDMEGAEVVGTRTHKMGSGARKPERDLKVSIKRRVGFEDTKWTFNVGNEKEVASE